MEEVRLLVNQLIAAILAAANFPPGAIPPFTIQEVQTIASCSAVKRWQFTWAPAGVLRRISMSRDDAVSLYEERAVLGEGILFFEQEEEEDEEMEEGEEEGE